MKDVKSSEIQSSSICQVPSISTLNMASEFCLDHDVLQFIDICIAERKQKQNLNPSKTQKTKTRTDLIDLTCDLCSAQSESTEKLWVICNGFRLTMKEKQLLESGGELTDRIIYAACSLLKKQFPDFGGLQTTLLQQSSRTLSQCNNAIQVILLPDRKHWAVISTVNCDNNTIKYYDSLFKDISIQTIVNLLKPYKSMNAQIMDMQPQKGAITEIIVRFQESGYPTVDVLCLLSNCNAMIRLGVKNSIIDVI